MSSILDNVIYDVGMHKGEDTDYYLKRGFKVVAFEADPSLIEQNKERFSDEITAGNLTIIEGAIVDDPSIELVPFYHNHNVSVWGTVVPNWAERNEKSGTKNSVISVPAVDFAKCLKELGVPYYMKIDIEGMDLVCLRELKKTDQRPPYISVESEKLDFRALTSEINLLTSLGYDRFCLVQQSGIGRQKIPTNTQEGSKISYCFEQGSSGLFGSDVTEQWMTADEAISAYKKVFKMYRAFGDYSIVRKLPLASGILELFRRATGVPLPGWYDTHAKHASVG